MGPGAAPGSHARARAHSRPPDAVVAAEPAGEVTLVGETGLHRSFADRPALRDQAPGWPQPALREAATCRGANSPLWPARRRVPGEAGQRAGQDDGAITGGSGDPGRRGAHKALIVFPASVRWLRRAHQLFPGLIERGLLRQFRQRQQRVRAAGAQQAGSPTSSCPVAGDEGTPARSSSIDAIIRRPFVCASGQPAVGSRLDHRRLNGVFVEDGCDSHQTPVSPVAAWRERPLRWSRAAWSRSAASLPGLAQARAGAPARRPVRALPVPPGSGG